MGPKKPPKSSTTSTTGLSPTGIILRETGRGRGTNTFGTGGETTLPTLPTLDTPRYYKYAISSSSVIGGRGPTASSLTVIGAGYELKLISQSQFDRLRFTPR